MRLVCIFLLGFLGLVSNLASAEFFPVQNRWLLIYLDAKKASFSASGLLPSFELHGNEKLVITVSVSPELYEEDRSWRKGVIAYIRKLHPRVLKSVHSYASPEFLSIFEPKFDMMWRIVLGKSLYGSIKNGRLEWKRGIY
jgi:hypothetical protein